MRPLLIAAALTAAATATAALAQSTPVLWPPAPVLPGAAAPPRETLSPQQMDGLHLFAKTCVYCHGEPGWAAREIGAREGPREAFIAHRTDLDPNLIRFVIRHGFQSMPAYTPTDLNKAQIEDIVAYLTRNNPPPGK